VGSGQLGVQLCCEADASSSRRRVTSSRIISVEYRRGTLCGTLCEPLTKRVHEILSLDQHPVDSCGELSMAEVRPISPQERLDDVL